MSEIYHVTIHGKVLESRDLRQLLARAVAEKRCMDDRVRRFYRDRECSTPGVLGLSGFDRATQLQRGL